jgi:hypothetical protein
MLSVTEKDKVQLEELQQQYNQASAQERVERTITSLQGTIMTALITDIRDHKGREVKMSRSARDVLTDICQRAIATSVSTNSTDEMLYHFFAWEYHSHVWLDKKVTLTKFISMYIAQFAKMFVEAIHPVLVENGGEDNEYPTVPRDPQEMKGIFEVIAERILHIHKER